VASVWSGFSFETRIRKRGRPQMASVAASPAELVKQYLQKKRTLPYLPVCAASSRVGQNADTVSTPSATMPTETKESPTLTPAGAGVFRSQLTAVTRTMLSILVE
jgi:hypothetical protein